MPTRSAFFIHMPIFFRKYNIKTSELTIKWLHKIFNPVLVQFFSFEIVTFCATAILSWFYWIGLFFGKNRLFLGIFGYLEALKIFFMEIFLSQYQIMVVISILKWFLHIMAAF